VLAAGKGTRMRSPSPKVVHLAAGRPLLHWVLDVAREVPCEEVVVVVGYGAGEVRKQTRDAGIKWVVQAEQLGTGDALAQAEGMVPAGALLLVLSGDIPLLRASTARALLAAADRGWGAMAVAELDQPGHLGRVIATPEGFLVRSVEAADASAEELKTRLVNAGAYALPAGDVFDYLRRVGSDNAQGEIYLPDALNLAAAEGREVCCIPLADTSEAWGVNTPEELSLVHEHLLARGRDEE